MLPDRRNNFDLLRLVAALQVVHAHASEHLHIAYGAAGRILNDVLMLFPGVPVFFVISGFLISMSYERSAGLAAYAQNRILRIFPGLWACFGVTLALLAVSGALTASFVGTGTFWLWTAGQLSVVQFFNPEALRSFGVGVVNGSLWTIPVEIEFYIALPVLSFMVLRRLGRGQGTAAIGGVALASFAVWCVSQHQLGSGAATLGHKLLQVTLAPHLFLFLLGVLMQRHWRRLLPMVQGKGAWWLALYVAERSVERLLIGSPAVVGEVGTPWAAAASALSFVLLGLTVMSIAYTNGSASERALRGHDVSFGVYIYHMLVINVFVALGWTGSALWLPPVFALVLLAAVCSWMFIERPALRAKRRAHPASSFAALPAVQLT